MILQRRLLAIGIRGAARRGFSGASAGKEGAAEEGLSFKWKVRLFGLATGVVGFAGFAYQLNVDKEFLLKVNEVAPSFVNVVGPYIGLQTATSNARFDYAHNVKHLEGHENIDIPVELKDIVGDNISIICLLRNGQAVVVNASPEVSTTQLNELVLQKLQLNSPVASPDAFAYNVLTYEIVDKEDENSDLEKLQKQTFDITIPEIKPGMTKQELQNKLLECQMILSDLFVQIELSKKYGTDLTKPMRSKAKVEAAMTDIQKQIKAKSSWF